MAGGVEPRGNGLRKFAHNPAIDAATHFRRFPMLLHPRMAVIALTLLISSCLAGIFILCFAGEFRRSRNASPERDSLLPLDDDTTR
jgi:hypothetical protein